MSYSLALDASGDLKQSGSLIGTVSGIDKLKQDLDIWFRERYQIDRFHPTYGSTLDNHVGGKVSALAVSQIRQEVSRVLSNYQKVQKAAFDKAPYKFPLNELLARVDNITVEVSTDSIFVTVVFTTATGTGGTINVGASI